MGVGSWFVDNMKRVICDGVTFFFTDNWMGGGPLCDWFSRLFDLPYNRLIIVDEYLENISEIT